MKLLTGILFMSLSFSAFAGEVKVKVNGMVCSLCGQGIEKKFKSEPSVKEMKVNMDEKIVTLLTHDGKDISDDTIKKLITEAGYNVASIERK